MAISFDNKIFTLGVLRQLSQHSNELSKIQERLASGQRIVSASDDAAGLMISQNLNLERRLYQQSIRNINDSISAIQIADSALTSLSSIVERQKELATQAANGVFNLKQRKALQDEADALTKEYNRIVQTTTFNGIQLLATPNKQINIQAGINTNDSIRLTFSDQLPVTYGDGTFTAGVSYTATNATHTVTGDFNRDGYLDIAAGGIPGFQLLLGNGDGSFKAVSTIAVGTINSLGIQTSDVNNDNILDVIVGNTSGTVSVLTGNGDGTFNLSSQNSTFVGSIFDLTISDFNGDGYKDIATGQTTGFATSVLLGNGNGTFLAAVTYAITSSAFPIESGDINSDGKVDLIISEIDGEIRYLLGNGDGTFKANTLLVDIGVTPLGLNLQDINRDGILDFVASENGGTVRSFIGNGDGTFTLGTIISATSGELALGDLNGDGIKDIVISGATSGQLSISIGNGDGTFQAMSQMTVGGNTREAQLGDFNSDGITDIVISNTSGNSLHFYSGNSAENIVMPYLNLLTTDEAKTAISTTSTVLEHISLERGSLGASMWRLESALRHAQNMYIQITEANSRIVDLDVASAVADMLRLQILQQTATAILAQANQVPNLAIMLLNNLDDKR
jgi:flagellin-like hook-associated protein FlgL